MLFKLFNGFAIVFFLIIRFALANGFQQSNGSSGVTSVYRGIGAVFNNPSGIASENAFGIAVWYQSHFLLDPLSSRGLACVVPLGKSFTAGGGYRQFGYELYKEQHANVVLARAFGPVLSAGLRFDMVSMRFGNGYGNATSLTGSAGLMARITPQLMLGVSIFNPHRAALSRKTSDHYPAIMQAGLCYTFSERTELAAGLSKSGDDREIISFSVSYKPGSKFKLHAAVSGGNEPFLFGYAFRISNFEIGMSSGYHYFLGFSPRILLTFKSR